MSTQCLDDSIAKDCEVRAIDAFVYSLELDTYGFRMNFGENGRPAYHPADLLKLFIYGYMNRTRSSRELERECCRNLEVIWLMRGLSPDHNTIARFRKQNPEGIRKVFEATVSIAKHHGLIGGRLVAGDSTKLRAQNSKKNNFNPKKVQRHMAYIDGRLEEFNRQMEQADGDTPEQVEKIKKDIARHTKRREQYVDMQQQMQDTGVEQISLSDPDSRQMILRGVITEVAYNVQSTVDAEHCIPIDYLVTNTNDSKAMGQMVTRATAILETNEFTAIYDKGYHTGSEFATADALGVQVLVAIPDVSKHAIDPDFDVAKFNYNPENDTHTCPANQTLVTNGTWYKKDRGKSFTMVKHYKTPACAKCPMRHRCTTNPKGRVIERSQHAHLIEQNAQRIATNPEAYRQRQAIVEHPFGTIKRQWGFDHIMTKKTKEHAAADVGLIFVAYNLRRLFNIFAKAAKGQGRPLLLPLIWLHCALLRFISHLQCALDAFQPVLNNYHSVVPVKIFRHF